ncbi:Serine threonine-protein kinase sgk2 [Rhizoctonia solani]|uniref:Serine threonine-protein kinase sgk2 n=1 Tax=Rhizoctonia solani TaxID=456999 RepID=A0A8H7M859_9AGAM|nr:Serine threonine-protein kinase sgk2 [Rhizoctonia solani]
MQATLASQTAVDTIDAAASVSRPGRKAEEMQEILREEINGAVFQYPSLCEDLPIDQAHLTATMERLAESPVLRRDGHWSIDCTNFESAENHLMHQAWADLLDVIMRAAFRGSRFRTGPQPIVALRETRVLYDHDDDTDTSPDIVQGHTNTDGRYHWGTLEFFAECKAKPDQLGEALMQIARYSRAMFTHQVYRRFIYSLALCGTKATFVRVGRSGIIHSTPIDVKVDPEQFIRGVASVFGLDDGQFGYDTRFYYWPPLAAEDDGRKRQLRVKTGNWRWIVMELMCHRMCLVGRATVVMLLCRVGNPKHRAVLKSIWRHEYRPDEGDTLRKLEGRPGICRCHWNEYLNDTKIKDRSLLAPSRYHIKGQKSYKKAQLKLLEVPEDRVHSLILMDEGARLWRIKRFRHLMVVLRDALVVGYASMAMSDQVHRDISEGNILCQAPGSKDWWEGGMPASVDHDGSDIVDGIPSDAFVSYDFDEVTLEDESEIKEASTLKEYVEGRYPSGKSIGRLYDMEFSVAEDRPETDVRANAERTGTIAFMSSQLLSEEPARHTFMHDLESFLWVLVWLVAVHAREYNQHNANLLREKLCSPDDSFKSFFIANSDRARAQMARVIDSADTDWAYARKVILRFARFLHQNLYRQGDIASDDDSSEPESEPLSGTTKLSCEEKWGLIRTLIGIFDVAIVKLQSSSH